MKKFALTAVTGLLFSLVVSPEARAASFSFTRIADTTAFSSISSPSINDSGTVAFIARNNELNSVFTGDGGELTNIFTRRNDNVSGIGGSPAINNTGTVAFYFAQAPRAGGVFIGSAGNPISQIANFEFSVGQSPSINDSGTVLYSVSNIAGTQSIVASNGRRQTTIASSSSRTINNPSINNAGIVAFSGFIGNPSQSQRGLFTSSSSGGGPTLVLDSGSIINTYINDQGTIAFSRGAGGGFQQRGTDIFTIDSDRTLSTITDASGPFSSFGNLSLNEQGTVAFEASLDTGGNGIFIGASPVTDRVIATGDSLFGSSVTSLGFLSGGLNNSTQVAFFAQLADGTSGIFRANPVSVPESASPLGVLAFGALCASSMLKRKQESRSHTAAQGSCVLRFPESLAVECHSRTGGS